MVKLSSNPTCVLSDADVLTNEQAERIAKVLTRHLPGANNVTESGKLLGVNAEGDVVLVEDNSMPSSSGASQGDVLTVGDNGPEWSAVPQELPASLGYAGQVLTVNSGATGVEWAAVPQELPIIGAAGQVLTVNATATGVEWAAPSGGGVTKQVISLTGATTSQDATSTTFTFNLASANQFYALGKLVSVSYKSHYIPNTDVSGAKIKLSWGSGVSQIITLDANVHGAANIFCASVFVGNETDISQASDPTLGFKFTKVEIVVPVLDWLDSTEADSLQIQLLG